MYEKMSGRKRVGVPTARPGEQSRAVEPAANLAVVEPELREYFPLDLLLACHRQVKVDAPERLPVDERLPLRPGVPHEGIRVGADVHNVAPRSVPLLRHCLPEHRPAFRQEQMLAAPRAQPIVMFAWSMR